MTMGTAPSPERRNDLDWLRVLSMGMVFLFHCAVFFSFDDWHVKNNHLSFGMTVFVGIVSQWIMPLFFVLSAISAYHALGHRTNRRFIIERFKRLIIPLLFGILVLAPPQVYLERVTHDQFPGSFIDFFPHYFSGFYRLGGNFAWMGIHLWYLEMLFIFSLLTLPLLQYLRGEEVRRIISRMVLLFGKQGLVFLLAVPVGIMEVLVNLQPGGVGRRDFGGWSPLVYLVFFILSYMVVSDEQCKLSIEKQRMAAFGVGILTTGIGYVLLVSGTSSLTWSFSFLRAFNAWFWLIAILGFGSTHLNRPNNLLNHANEAVLPFYVLHQTVIVIIGYMIAGWDWNVVLKYLILSTVSFFVILLLFEWVIKRSQVLRFLFGMKPT